MLDGGEAGFSILVAIYGVGFIGGSLRGASGGGLPLLKRRYLLGIFLLGAGYVASGVAPVFATALVTFVAAGFGNGLLLTYERLLIQELVPESLAGRVFGVKDALTAWAFAIGFLAGPVLLELAGTRALIVACGVGALLVGMVALAGLRSLWAATGPPAAEAEAIVPEEAPAAVRWTPGEPGPNPLGEPRPATVPVLAAGVIGLAVAAIGISRRRT